MKLNDLFDGDEHVLELDDLFVEARTVVSDWEEGEEEDDLDVWETPNLVPVYTQTGDSDRPGSLRSKTQQGWGTLCIAMLALSNIVGFKREMWEKNHWSKDGESLNKVTHTFQFIPLGDDTWQGGRL